MELWVRTQNKEKILKVDNLEFLERNGHKYIASNMDLVASYKTKERALEVLDEIQDILKPQQYEVPTGRGTFTTSPNISNYIYEMPKD